MPPLVRWTTGFPTVCWSNCSVVVAPPACQLIGVAWEPDRLQTEEVGDNRLRPLAGLVDALYSSAAPGCLCEWTANYYLSPLAAVVRMVLVLRRIGRGFHARWSNIVRPAISLLASRLSVSRPWRGSKAARHDHELAAHAEAEATQ